MDDDSTYSLESAIEGVETAVERVETAVARVETAVKDKWSAVQWLGVIVIGVFFWSLPGTIWHSKWRYSAAYSIPSSEIYVQDKPHDCAFLAAPLGEKYCHYERTVSITRWARTKDGSPIVSHDDGKTWSTFDPAGETVPQYSTVKAVYVGWEKKED